MCLKYIPPALPEEGQPFVRVRLSEWAMEDTQPPSDIYPPNYIKSQHTIDELSTSYEQTVAGDLTPLKTLDQCLYLFTCNGMALW